jgi:hypothetical protein
MSDIPPTLRTDVAHRAGHRCEYCRLSQAGQEAAFHIDHVVPRAQDGPTTIENLALACVSCSLRKWAKQTAIDPESGDALPLFNPRTDSWTEHFRWDGVRRGSHGDRPRHRRGAGDEPRVDPRHPRRGNGSRAAPSGLIPQFLMSRSRPPCSPFTRSSTVWPEAQRGPS